MNAHQAQNLLDWPERDLHITEELGCAYTKVPPGYAGPAKVELHGKSRVTVGFPSEEEANRAAVLAVGYMGGYPKAIVYPAFETEVSFPTANDWFFS